MEFQILFKHSRAIQVYFCSVIIAVKTITAYLEKFLFILVIVVLFYAAIHG